MVRLIDAVFENGVLKPTEPLRLPEGSTVRITVEESPASQSTWDHDQFQRAIEEIASMRVESPSNGEAVAREHDRYLYGDLSGHYRSDDK